MALHLLFLPNRKTSGYPEHKILKMGLGLVTNKIKHVHVVNILLLN